MKQIFAIARHQWPVAFLVGLALWFFHHYWHAPMEAQSIAGLFSFLAAAILISVTVEYVRTNQENLALLREQWEEQNKLGLRFGLKKLRNGGARVWIANVGLRQFMVTKARIRQRGGKTTVLHKHMIVRPSSVRGFNLPDEIWKPVSLMLDLEVSLEYEWQGKVNVSEGKAYNLVIAIGQTRIIRIRQGIDELYSATCAKCKDFATPMRTDGVANFDALQKREKAMELELAASCPNHSSQWALTVETQRSINALEKAQDEEMDA